MFKRTASSLVLLSLALTQLAGCIPYPIITGTSAPDVSPHIPPDLMASERQVMILMNTMTVRSHRSIGSSNRDSAPAFTTESPIFMRASDMRDDFPSVSRTGLGFGAWLFGGHSMPIQGSWRFSSEVLKVCIFVEDGRLIHLLRASGGEWSQGSKKLTDAERHDLVAKLSDKETAFEWQPCFWQNASLHWSTELRGRASQFIAKMWKE